MSTEVIFAVSSLLCLFRGKGTAEKLGAAFFMQFLLLLAVGISLATTWVATQLFGVNFYVAFQIIALGTCISGLGNLPKKETFLS